MYISLGCSKYYNIDQAQTAEIFIRLPPLLPIFESGSWIGHERPPISAERLQDPAFKERFTDVVVTSWVKSVRAG